MELEVSKAHAKANARVDVRHYTADPVTVEKQRALEASKAAVQHRKLALAAAREVCTFDLVTSALLTNVERQWAHRNEVSAIDRLMALSSVSHQRAHATTQATRGLASTFVRKNFPALCEALHAFFVKGCALYREASAEVSRL